MKDEIFRAYDIRGRYPQDFAEDDVRVIARVVNRHLPKGKVVLGHDGRKSSPSLYRALVSAFPSRRVIKAGLVTTPMLYFLVHDLRAAGGITVTASHNPKNINGLKIVGKNEEAISGIEVKKMLTRL